MAAAAAALANSLGGAGMSNSGPQNNPLLSQYAALLGMGRQPGSGIIIVPSCAMSRSSVTLRSDFRLPHRIAIGSFLSPIKCDPSFRLQKGTALEQQLSEVFQVMYRCCCCKVCLPANGANAQCRMSLCLQQCTGAKAEQQADARWLRKSCNWIVTTAALQASVI